MEFWKRYLKIHMHTYTFDLPIIWMRSIIGSLRISNAHECETKNITHAWAHVQSQLLFVSIRRWVRTEVGRSREFVLLCQAHKVDHGMASYVLMWWHDTIIYTPLIGVVVVHTWHMPAWWWYSIWTAYHMNTPGLLNVFIYMQVSPCFPVVVLDIFESSESWLSWRRA